LLHPDQQNAFAYIALACEQATAPTALFCSCHSRNCFASALFTATKPNGNGLLKKMRPDAIDRAITLRRWNMTIPILRVELATAKNAGPASILFYEESSP
jgi:hypothetical protein